MLSARAGHSAILTAEADETGRRYEPSRMNSAAQLLFPMQSLVGGLLLVAAACNLWRLSRWHGAKTVSEPLLLILHIAYGWLCSAPVCSGSRC